MEKVSCSPIISELLTKGIIRRILNPYVKGKHILSEEEFLEDFTQDLLLILLEYDQEKLLRLYVRGELLFFIRRIVRNQIMSNTSAFFYNYNRWQTKKSRESEFTKNQLDEFYGYTTQERDTNRL